MNTYMKETTSLFHIAEMSKYANAPLPPVVALLLLLACLR
jgi:hypothetical protein